MDAIDPDFLSKQIEALEDLKVDMANLMKPAEWKSMCHEIEQAKEALVDGFKKMQIPEFDRTLIPHTSKVPMEQLDMIEKLRKQRDEIIRNGFRVPASGKLQAWADEREWSQYGEFDTDSADVHRVTPLHAEQFHDWAFLSGGGQSSVRKQSTPGDSSGAGAAQEAVEKNAVPSMLSMVDAPPVENDAGSPAPGFSSWSDWFSQCQSAAGTAPPTDASKVPPPAAKTGPGSEEWKDYLSSLLDEDKPRK